MRPFELHVPAAHGAIGGGAVNADAVFGSAAAATAANKTLSAAIWRDGSLRWSVTFLAKTFQWVNRAFSQAGLQMCKCQHIRQTGDDRADQTPAHPLFAGGAHAF